jgi:hypothetical protein
VLAGLDEIGKDKELGRRSPRSESRSWTRCGGLVAVIGVDKDELPGMMPMSERRPLRIPSGCADDIEFVLVFETVEVSGDSPRLESKPPRMSAGMEAVIEVAEGTVLSEVWLLRIPRPVRRSFRMSSIKTDLVELGSIEYVGVKILSIFSSSEKRPPRMSSGAGVSVELELTALVIVGRPRTFPRSDSKLPTASTGVVAGVEVARIAPTPRSESILPIKSTALVGVRIIDSVELGCTRMFPTLDKRPPRRFAALLVDVRLALSPVVDGMTPTPRFDSKPPTRSIALLCTGFKDTERMELGPNKSEIKPPRSSSAGSNIDGAGDENDVLVGVATCPRSESRPSRIPTALVTCAKTGMDVLLSTLPMAESKSPNMATALVACGRFELYVELAPSLAAENRSSKTLIASVACGRIGRDVIAGRLSITESKPFRRFSGSMVRLGLDELVVVGSSLPPPRSDNRCSRRF